MNDPNQEVALYVKLDDETLAEKCRLDDNLAFQVLMNRYMRHIFNFAWQYAKTREDAEDIAQDTFFKLWRYIGKYAAGRKFKPWLFTIARNTALDHIKKKRASSFSDLDDVDNDLAFADTLEDPEPLPPELFENAALADKLRAALDHIHPEHRATLLMHYQEGLSFDEIALIIGKPMNTIKSWHRRALIKLRGILVTEI